MPWFDYCLLVVKQILCNFSVNVLSRGVCVWVFYLFGL